jgi:hypothetical protein
MHSSNPVHAIQGNSLKDDNEESTRLEPAPAAACNTGLTSKLHELNVAAGEEGQNKTSLTETATLVTAFGEPQTTAHAAEGVEEVVHESGLPNNCWVLNEDESDTDADAMKGIQSQEQHHQQQQQQSLIEVRFCI